MTQHDDYTKDEIESERVENLIASLEHSHSLFCLKLEYNSVVNMTDEERDQLMKLVEVYLMDCGLMGLSNSPKYNEQTKNEV